MTRINLVPVEELSDQHLIAEYHELPRCIKQDINTSAAPHKYTLGKGHVKWAKKHSRFLVERYERLYIEMKYRGFNANYPPADLIAYYKRNCKKEDKLYYSPSWVSIEISRQRLIDKIRQKPNFYRWTKRSNPYKFKINITLV